ncbi:hypothetical protein AMR41_10575 [Hapalosiphon sp. MRB220]|nr:hypothetical protein AMR41_10575 [Hapalosiphon sp. MRB220]
MNQTVKNIGLNEQSQIIPLLLPSAENNLKSLYLRLTVKSLQDKNFSFKKISKAVLLADEYRVDIKTLELDNCE